ncbi:MAG: acyl-CoA thioesterase [Opitutales bacterium]
MASSFQIERRVEFHETDLAGIMHFSNFFRWMESAEHAFLRSIGASVHEERDGQQTGWPRVGARCDYLRPLTFEETVNIELLVAEIRSRAIRYRFGFWKDKLGAKALAACGEITAVCVALNPETRNMESIAIPEDLRAALEVAPAERIEAVSLQERSPAQPV